MSSKDTDMEHTSPHATNTVSVQHGNSESHLISVLSAMQASMDETNTYLRSIFEERQSAPKRPRVCSEAAGSVEAGNDYQPAPKRAKSADESNSNDCPSHQQSTDELSDTCDEPQEVVNPLQDDTLSLFGGPDFDARSDEELDNASLLSNIAQNLSCNEQTGPPVSEHLAKIINSKLSEELDLAKLKETLGKYKRPENCTEMYVPKVNQEIWQKMKPYAKRADIKMANLQDTIMKGLSSMSNCINELLQCRETKTIPNYRNIKPQPT